MKVDPMAAHPIVSRATSCRICGHSIEDFLAFGDMPLANDLVADAGAAGAQDRFPLTLAFCPHCSLVQLRETVDPERLFRDYAASGLPAGVFFCAFLIFQLANGYLCPHCGHSHAPFRGSAAGS